jgi:hypothetical protein
MRGSLVTNKPEVTRRGCSRLSSEMRFTFMAMVRNKTLDRRSAVELLSCLACRRSSFRSCAKQNR